MLPADDKSYEFSYYDLILLILILWSDMNLVKV